MIEVSHLTKKYGNHIAVDDLSFAVEKGQIYGFLGPNGAGKSTTMNIMTGYLAASSGTVVINGFDILTQPEEAKRNIGYLPEIPPLYPDMTVSEYLEFVAELKKVPKNERTASVNEVCEMTFIDDVKNRLIKNLSKGYKQRVGLAQAIIGNPEVIILDEPTVGLDPKQIIEIRELIKKLSQNHTIILSSHILSEVSTLCDHIMIISQGKLVASDTPEGLQNMMNTSAEIIAVCIGSSDDVKEVLESIDGITSYSISDGTEKDTVNVSVITDTDIDIRKDLSLKLSSKGIAVLSLGRNEKSLEDIFLKLTEEDPLDNSEQNSDFENDENELNETENERKEDEE